MTHEEFQEKLGMFVNDLKSENFNVKKQITEFSIYDSDIDHDINWILNK